MLTNKCFCLFHKSFSRSYKC